MDKIKASTLADLAYYSRFKPPSRLITFAAPASTLTNFPALVKCNSTFHIGTQTGYDVHFQDLSGNELYFDLDYYDSVTGNGAWWVQIPSLPSSGPTSIKMLYGDSSASTNGSSPATVFADYSYVYHFNDLDNLSSVVGSYTPTEGNTEYGSKSIVSNTLTGCGMRFLFTRGYGDAAYYLTLGNGFEVTKGTISVFATSGVSSWTGDRWVTMNTGWTQYKYEIGPTQFLPVAGNVSVTIARSATDGFYCYGGSCNSSEVGFVVNCAIQNTSSATAGYIRWGTPLLTITGNSSAPTDITFDEIRISTTTYKPAAWLQYEQNMLIDHSNYVTYGPEA